MSAARIDPDELTPSNPDGKATSVPDFYLDVIAAINEHADEIDNGGATGALNAAHYGMSPDIADNRDAFMAAVAAAIAAGVDLYIPPGRYVISKYVYISGANGLRIFGYGATIVYPSDNVALVADGTANNTNAARSALLFKYCKRVTIDGLGFEGGQNPIVDAANVGAAVYARNCRRVTQRKTKLLYGGSIHQQDQQPDTNGTGDSIAVSGGVVTLSDTAALFQPGHVGSRVVVSNAANQSNNGTFTVTAYISATKVQYANADAVAETSSFRWIVEDGDFATLLDNVEQDRARYVNRLPSYSVVRGGTFRWPTAFLDVCGLGDMLTVSGTTVTLTDAAGRFTPVHDGHYLQIANATTANHNGIYQLTYISATQVSWQNTKGGLPASEVYAGNWWIMNGEKSGLGAGAGAWSVSGSTATFTAAVAAFTASDIGKSLLLRNPTNTVNRDAAWQVEAYVSPTQVQVSLNAATAISEDFVGVWTLDGFDETGGANAACGSTHGFYIDGANDGKGRQHILFDGVTFVGNRTCCIKGSSSGAPIRNITITNCRAVECDSLVVFGADDAQEHAGLTVTNNTLVDCGPVHRRGHIANEAITILGSRNVLIQGNHLYYTRESITHQFTSTGGLYLIHAFRYVTGNSQPIEDVQIVDNKFTADPSAVSSAAYICDNAIRVQQVGRREKYDSEGTLTKSGNVMTMTASHANFLAAEDVGKTITLVNCSDSANNGTFTIESVPSSQRVTFANASGVGGAGHTVGTYRINPRNDKNSGGCVVARNYINVGGYGVYCTNCVSPQITGNQFLDLNYDVYLDANAYPVVTENRDLGSSNNTGAGGGVHPRVVCKATNSWPMIWNNWVSALVNGAAKSRGWDIYDDAGGNKIDHPFLGKTVRCLPTNAQEEIVFAYGAGLVDGDAITVAGTTLTYKASSPGAGQFNSMNVDDASHVSLLTRINAIAGLSAAEYGAGFAVPVVSGHVRVRKTTATTSDGTFSITESTLSSGALAVIYNDSGTTNSTAKSVGSGSAGPTPDKIVAWSPMCSMQGVLTVMPDNSDGRTVLQANYPLPVKNAANSGACEVINVGDCTGKSPEFRVGVG